MYKKWTIDDIQKELKYIALKWNYPCEIPVEISTRARSRVGAFFFKKTKEGICGTKFVFAKVLLDGSYPEEKVKEVIIHEYLHYYCDTKSGVSNGHNKIFKEACIRSNIPPRATFKYKESIGVVKVQNRKEYKIYCKNCGKLVCVHRRSDAALKKIKNYISSCCESKLILK